MTRSIIVGVDGSAVSLDALRWAVDEAARRGTGVMAVNAWRSDPATAGLTSLDLIQVRPREDVRDAQMRLLVSAVAEASAEAKDVMVEQHLVEGQPGPVLVQLAAEADLLVVGSHGYGRLREALLGSVSSYCVHHSPCPVVVIPDRGREREEILAAAEAAPSTPGPSY